MEHNHNVLEDVIKLAMKYQSNIVGKRVTKDEVIKIALHSLIKEQEKILKGFAKLCK